MMVIWNKLIDRAKEYFDAFSTFDMVVAFFPLRNIKFVCD